MCLQSTTATYLQLCNVLSLAIKLILDVSHQQCVTLVLDHLLQVIHVASPWKYAPWWEAHRQWQAHHWVPDALSSPGHHSQNARLFDLSHHSLCRQCDDLSVSDSFVVCLKIDKTAVLHETYAGSVTNARRPFPLHRVYWTRTLILRILPSAKRQAIVLPGHVEWGSSSVSEDKVRSDGQAAQPWINESVLDRLICCQVTPSPEQKQSLEQAHVTGGSSFASWGL